MSPRRRDSQKSKSEFLVLRISFIGLFFCFFARPASAGNGIVDACAQASFVPASTLFDLSPSISGNNFVGQYSGEKRYSRYQMWPSDMPVSQITDSHGNFLVFRVVKAPIKPGSIVYAPAGVSYSFSPAIAKEWGDEMIDRSGQRKYWLLIGENNLFRDHVHPGQSSNEKLRMTMESRVVTPDTNEVGLNEIKLDPNEQNVIWAIRGDQLECVFSKLGDPFSARSVVDLFQKK